MSGVPAGIPNRKQLSGEKQVSVGGDLDDSEGVEDTVTSPPPGQDHHVTGLQGVQSVCVVAPAPETPYLCP